MKVKHYDNDEEWLQDRKGKVTGTKLEAIVNFRGDEPKIGVYQLIADKLTLDDGTEDGRARGHDLEPEAIQKLGEHCDIEFLTDKVMWFSDEDNDMAFSPDGYSDDLTIAAEAKCLGSALTVEAIIKNDIPSGYRTKFHLQRLQAFIVNEKLERHFMAFYDPRITAHPLHVLELTREEAEDEIKHYHDYQQNKLKFINEWVEKLAF